MTEPRIDWPTELQNESRREPENTSVGLFQIMTPVLTDYETGGTLPPARSDLVAVKASDGAAVVSDEMVDRHGKAHLAALGGIPAENIQRISEWIRDHYSTGSFRCPSGDESAGD